MSEAAATHTFKCPNCGGEITYSGGAATSLQCHYCGMSVPVPDALRPKQPDVITPVVLDVSSIMRVAGTGLSGQQRQSQRTGCIICAIVVFVIGIILLTTVLPLVLVSNVTSQIPAIPAEVGAMATAIAEPTREPTRRAPTPTPTPAFAEVALKFGSQGMGPGQFANAHAGGLYGAVQM